jgi:hypothetical protein
VDFAIALSRQPVRGGCGTDEITTIGACGKLSNMTDDDESAENRAIRERLNADRPWLAAQGIRVSQLGTDPVSGKTRVYLTNYSEKAHRILVEHYGPGMVVSPQSRQWIPAGDNGELGKRQGARAWRLTGGLGWVPVRVRRFIRG